MSENNQIKSMILLLEDPDEKIFQQIKENIFNDIKTIRPFLDEYRKLSTDTLFQERLQDIIDEIDTMNYALQLSNWAERANPDLIDAILIIQDAVFPEFETLNTLNQFKELRQKIWMALSNNQTAIEKIKVINQYIYNIFKLKILKADSVSTIHLCFQNIFDERRANNLMQTLFYSALSQNLGLPVYPVILPDMFVLGYKDKVVADLSFANEQHYDIVFYINPYENGNLFSKNLIEKYLESKKIEQQAFYYSTVDNLTSILLYLRLIAKTIAANNKTDYRLLMISHMIKVLESKVNLI